MANRRPECKYWEQEPYCVPGFFDEVSVVPQVHISEWSCEQIVGAPVPQVAEKFVAVPVLQNLKEIDEVASLVAVPGPQTLANTLEIASLI